MSWCSKCHAGSEVARGVCPQGSNHGVMSLEKRPFPNQPVFFGKSKEERERIKAAQSGTSTSVPSEPLF